MKKPIFLLSLLIVGLTTVHAQQPLTDSLVLLKQQESLGKVRLKQERATVKAMAKMEKEKAKAEKAQKKAEKELRKMERAQDKVEKATASVSKAEKRLTNAQKKLEKMQKNLNRDIDKNRLSSEAITKAREQIQKQ